MMTNERIDELLARYFVAATTDDEERRLRDWFRTGEVPRHLLHLRSMFAGLEELSAERIPTMPELPLGSPALPAAAGDAAAAEPSALRFPVRRRRIWGAVAAAALLFGLFLGAELLRRPYCYIDGRPVYDREEALRTVSYLDGFARLDDPLRMVDDLIDNR